MYSSECQSLNAVVFNVVILKGKYLWCEYMDQIPS